LSQQKFCYRSRRLLRKPESQIRGTGYVVESLDGLLVFNQTRVIPGRIPGSCKPRG
jgi:hypothetical protein